MIAGSLLKLTEERGYISLPHTRESRQRLHLANILDHLTSGTTTAITKAKGHQQRRLLRATAQVLLLEVGPGAIQLFRRCQRFIGACIGTLLRRCAKVSQDARSGQALPPEAIVRQAIILAPTNFDGEEVFQARLFNQLRQSPGIAKDIGQPENGRFVDTGKIFLKEGAAQQKLAGQRFGTTQITIGLNPHAPDQLPASLCRSLSNSLKQFRIILAYVIIKLWLALRKMIFWILLHQTHHSMEGTTSFAPCLPQRPEPGYINMSMPGANHLNI